MNDRVNETIEYLKERIRQIEGYGPLDLYDECDISTYGTLCAYKEIYKMLTGEEL